MKNTTSQGYPAIVVIPQLQDIPDLQHVKVSSNMNIIKDPETYACDRPESMAVKMNLSRIACARAFETI